MQTSLAMKLTKEQEAIVQTNENIVINAVAGSGKTSTLIEYARTRDRNAKILYVAFNRSVKLEAKSKFAHVRLHNVAVETAHSLALRHVGRKYNFTIQQNYKSYEVVKILGIQNNGEAHSEYIIANHILKFVAYFCNSTAAKVSELNYLDVVDYAKAIFFVKAHYVYIEKQTRIFLTKMKMGEVGVTHDFYLKLFQLEKIELGFDYILFDEGQDASPTMLDVFLRQSAVKVIVGDSHQQIYSWRYAINSLEKVDFKHYTLSLSFRFNDTIAHIANDVMQWKHIVSDGKEMHMQGAGECSKVKTRAVIARSNVGLLAKAIEYVMERKNIKHLYFEGNINSYTYAEDGASLYDVLNLSIGKKHLIRDELIKQMKDIYELEDYIKKTDDVQLAMMLDIVEEYGESIPIVLKKLKELHVGDKERDKAEVIFSTVHRSKGLEYDSIQLVNDFITEEKVKELAESIEGDRFRTKLMEEVNILYVAITRTRRNLYIPEDILPKYKETNNQVRILKNTEAATKPDKANKGGGVEARYEEVRKTHKDAYKPWTAALDDELTIMYCEGLSVRDMMRHFGRTRGAIQSRIKKLELKEAYG